MSKPDTTHRSLVIVMQLALRNPLVVDPDRAITIANEEYGVDIYPKLPLSLGELSLLIDNALSAKENNQ